MKRTLLASTALVAMSGAAFANDNISLSGSAEMGIADSGTGDAMFHKDADVTFTLAAATDAGLSFGTALNFDDDASANSYAVHVSGDFGKLTLGDTDGAFDWAMADVSGAGAIADNHTTHAGYDSHGGFDGRGGQVLTYTNSFGAMEVALSFAQEGDDGGGDVGGAGVKGGFGDVTLGVGFQTDDDANVAGVSVGANFGEISGGLNYSRMSDDAEGDTTHLGVGATYTMGGTTVNVNFGQKDMDGMEATGFGLAAQYDLGGGAKVQFGYGNSDNDDGSTEDTWSLGLKMAF